MEYRNLTGIRSIWVQLTDLARLEAGQESVDIQPFGAAGLLGDLVATQQPLAAQKGLILQADGPTLLPVKRVEKMPNA
ncbi:hypothetical protein [Spirosoma aerophilum]